MPENRGFGHKSGAEAQAGRQNPDKKNLSKRIGVFKLGFSSSC
jgi:hypothetical protein